MKLPLIFIFFIPLFSSAQPIPPDFKSSVVFIYFDQPLGEPLPDGTGFFIGKLITNDTSRMAIFVATAKHVLTGPDGKLVDHVLYRLNVKDSTRFVYVGLKYEGKDKNVFFHPDSAVDLAVIAGMPGKTDYNFKIVTEAFFLTRDEYRNIPEGTEAFFMGLFVNHIGEKHNFPIFRFGHLAISTNEKVLFMGKKREMAIIETSTYGGNSGSPIFYKIFKDQFNWQYRLGGIVNGYFGNYEPLQTVNTNNQVYATMNNVGIAAVTPAYFISDILEEPEVRALIK